MSPIVIETVRYIGILTRHLLAARLAVLPVALLVLVSAALMIPPAIALLVVAAAIVKIFYAAGWLWWRYLSPATAPAATGGR